jgi:hypothetical protein
MYYELMISRILKVGLLALVLLFLASYLQVPLSIPGGISIGYGPLNISTPAIYIPSDMLNAIIAIATVFIILYIYYGRKREEISFEHF